MKILSKLEDNIYYLMQDQLKRYIKVIYCNGNLFTETLKGSKSNFYNISKKDALKLISTWSLSKDKLINFGIGFTVEKIK